jgi:hypothetical protein
MARSRIVGYTSTATYVFMILIKHRGNAGRMQPRLHAFLNFALEGSERSGTRQGHPIATVNEDGWTEQEAVAQRKVPASADLVTPTLLLKDPE